MIKNESLAEQIKNLYLDFDGDYYDSLVEALSSYHSMIDAGILTPRGNRLANVLTNVESSNYDARQDNERLV